MLLDESGRVTHAHVVVCGSSGAGKSALVRAFATGRSGVASPLSPTEYERTIQDTLVTRHSLPSASPAEVRAGASTAEGRGAPKAEGSASSKTTNSNEAKIIVSVTEVGGARANEPLLVAAIRSASALLVVFDIADSSSFQHAQLICIDYASALPILLVGSRVDLLAKDRSLRQVSSDQAKEFSAPLQIPFCETTAKAPQNVTTVFNTLLTLVQQRASSQGPVRRSLQSTNAATASTTSSWPDPNHTLRRRPSSRRRSLQSDYSSNSSNSRAPQHNPTATGTTATIPSTQRTTASSSIGSVSAISRRDLSSPVSTADDPTPDLRASHASSSSSSSSAGNAFGGALDLLKQWRQHRPASNSNTASLRHHTSLEDAGSATVATSHANGRTSLPSLTTSAGPESAPTHALGSPLTPTTTATALEFAEDDERYFVARLMTLTTGTAPPAAIEGGVRWRRERLLSGDALSSPRSGGGGERGSAGLGIRRPRDLVYRPPETPAVIGEAFFGGMGMGTGLGDAGGRTVTRKPSRHVMQLNEMMREIDSFQEAVQLGEQLQRQEELEMEAALRPRESTGGGGQEEEEHRVQILKGILAEMDEGSVVDLVRRYGGGVSFSSGGATAAGAGTGTVGVLGRRS
ncbi:hypothetical protein BC830DRAFT_1143943 [Chytriomyces sp. MP71]|nr:hypothetical protein BC830DRAFT_1143943 [Chytriomyces sp. MP71]